MISYRFKFLKCIKKKLKISNYTIPFQSMGGPFPPVNEFISKIIAHNGIVMLYTLGHESAIAQISQDSFKNLVPLSMRLLRETVELMRRDLYDVASRFFD